MTRIVGRIVLHFKNYILSMVNNVKKILTHIEILPHFEMKNLRHFLVAQCHIFAFILLFSKTTPNIHLLSWQPKLNFQIIEKICADCIASKAKVLQKNRT